MTLTGASGEEVVMVDENILYYMRDLLQESRKFADQRGTWSIQCSQVLFKKWEDMHSNIFDKDNEE